MAVQNSVSTGGLSKIMQMTTTPPVNYRLESGEEQIIENKLWGLPTLGSTKKKTNIPTTTATRSLVPKALLHLCRLGLENLPLTLLTLLAFLVPVLGQDKLWHRGFLGNSWQFLTILNNSWHILTTNSLKTWRFLAHFYISTWSSCDTVSIYTYLHHDTRLPNHAARTARTSSVLSVCL